MFLRETKARFIIEKNLLTTTLMICMFLFILSLIWIIFQMPKELRIGVMPAISNLSRSLEKLEREVKEENIIRDIEIRRHEEILQFIQKGVK